MYMEHSKTRKTKDLGRDQDSPRRLTRQKEKKAITSASMWFAIYMGMIIISTHAIGVASFAF